MSVETRPLSVVLILLLAAAALPAAATSYVPLGDAELVAVSPVVAVVRILDAAPDAGTLPATRYLAEVEEVLQGHLPGGRIEVHVPGGTSEDGLHGWQVYGAPHYARGERALLFLAPRSDGSYGLVHLMLGSFRVVEHDGVRLAVRDLSAAHEVQATGVAARSSSFEPARRFDDFARWIADRAAGIERPADYATDLPAAEVARVHASYALLNDGGQCSGAKLPIRWFTFDGAGLVAWFMNAGGQPGMAGSPPGVNEFRAALAVWTDHPASDVRLSYAGTTAATSPSSDDTGVISFDDPNDDISGSFGGSGTLAIGGPYFSCQASNFRGNSYRRAVRGFVITQDGAGSFFAGHGGQDGAEVFAHEIGHTLGLGHSGVAGALMRSFAYGNGRGANLGSDDRNALADLYGDGAVAGGTPPAAPSHLAAAPLSATQLRLSWRDNSGDETSFRVEIQEASGFREVGSLGAGATAATVNNLLPDTAYSFRVRACNEAGCSAYSNTATATTRSDGGAASPPAAPSQLAAQTVSSTGARLTWRDNSGDEEAFHVEASSGGAWFQAASTPVNATSLTVSGLDPDTAYSFRVRARNAAGYSAYSNTAQARTASDEPQACQDPKVLCLQGGRFAVRVTWRDQRSTLTGSGTPLAGSEQSGYFWFFNRDNVELVVKVLDGRAVNGAFWVFYGALSDVEYEIRVLDTASGVEQVYRNPPGEICGRGDTLAFLDAPASTEPFVAPSEAPASEPAAGLASAVPGASLLAASGACNPAANRLCLQNGRFEVTVGWTNQRAGGASGVGRVMPSEIGGDKSGFFWFFNSTNIELVVKMIDGRGVNGRWWFFYGGLSDVEYDVTVRDTLTGQRRSYHNSPGDICGRGDTSAF